MITTAQPPAARTPTVQRPARTTSTSRWAPITISRWVVRLAVLIALLALVAAGLGVFWQDGGSQFAVTSVRGETVQIHGRGLYHYDSIASAAQIRAGDVVTLILALPLLLYAISRYRRGSLRGSLLLVGTLGYFLYTYASIAFNTAYNSLFLVYVALFSASLFAFILAWTSIDIAALPAHFSPRLPRRGIALFMFLISVFLLLMWLGLLVPSLLKGQAPPKLETTTTMVIQALDLGIVAPVALLAGVLLLQRAPLGYMLASTVLIKVLTLGTAVSAMAVGQLLAGISLSIGEMVGFPLLTLLGAALTAVLLRHISEEALAAQVSGAD